jgi:ubiquinone/menaquinone biosynthesis C-methylase UbiE
MSLFNSPLSLEKADRLIALLSLSEGARVLDVGCGRGEFLIRLIEASRANGLGIDRDAACISAARASAAGRISEVPHEFREGDVQRETPGEGSFDLAICIGSTHALGSGEAAYPNTLQTLIRLLRPGGQMLIGECYWKQTPAAAYLQLIGEPVGIYRDHAENVSIAEGHGLVPLYATVSNDDEWDHFEWSHRMKLERQAALHPDDPTMAERVKRSRAWRDGYLRWGRSTMGFGFYLFLKPPDPTPLHT